MPKFQISPSQKLLKIWSNKVTVNWIPGHKGYEGNEIADKLAKAGSMKETNSDTYNKIPFNILASHIKNHFNKTILNRYKKQWNKQWSPNNNKWATPKIEKLDKKLITNTLEIINNKFINHN